VSLNAVREFWRWFEDHQSMIADFESDREAVFDQISAALGRVDPDLSFEFGPVHLGADGRTTREFVISASGIRRAFPAVTALIDSAPLLDLWRITAFRPRREDLHSVTFRDKTVSPEDVQFTLLSNGEMPGLYLFLPGFGEGDTASKMIGYLLLDEALGEFDVVERLGFVEMLSKDATREGERFPLLNLPEMFDRLRDQLQQSSRRLT
jgi:hypothetical protein